jgi:hypothetical protein
VARYSQSSVKASLAFLDTTAYSRRLLEIYGRAAEAQRRERRDGITELAR